MLGVEGVAFPGNTTGCSQVIDLVSYLLRPAFPRPESRGFSCLATGVTGLGLMDGAKSTRFKAFGDPPGGME